MVSPRGFDSAAMFAAIEQLTAERGLSWDGVQAQIGEQSRDLDTVTEPHPIATTTITQLRTGRGTTCQHSLILLRWLGRPPEDFIAEPAAGTAGAALPEPGPAYLLRWDLKATYAALNEARQARGATWEQTARRLYCTANQLTGLRTATYGTGMRLAMRISQALRRPARDFVVAATW